MITIMMVAVAAPVKMCPPVTDDGISPLAREEPPGTRIVSMIIAAAIAKEMKACPRYNASFGSSNGAMMRAKAGITGKQYAKKRAIRIYHCEGAKLGMYLPVAFGIMCRVLPKE
jgi:hypothetical protein